MNSSRRYFILLAIVFAGATLESLNRLKLSKFNDDQSTAFRRNDFKDMDLRPFHMRMREGEPKPQSKVSLRQIDRVGKAGSLKLSDVTFSNSHTFSEQHIANAKPSGKTPANKKEKKKKVNKQLVKATPPGKSRREKIDANKINPPQSETENYGMTPNPEFAGIPFSGNGITNEDEVPKTTEAWLDILLIEPNYKKLTRFIDLYQSRQFPTSTFYSVLDAMIMDSREDVHTLAVRAAGSTPSTPSFLFLTKTMETPGISSGVKTLAREQLIVYRDLQYLSTLKVALMTNSAGPFAHAQAAILIKDSARINLGTKGKDPKKNPTTPATLRNAPDAKLIQRYVEIAELLRSLLKTKTFDNSFAQEASSTIKFIEELTS